MVQEHAVARAQNLHPFYIKVYTRFEFFLLKALRPFYVFKTRLGNCKIYWEFRKNLRIH